MRANGLLFGPFRFESVSGTLLRDGEPVALGRRGELILRRLLERRGEIVSKAELVDAAWPKQAVEESNLSVQVALLRKRLALNAGGPNWITTIARVGYRFAPAPAAPSMGTANPSLAILPFTDLGTGTADLADGLLEDLITALTRFRSLDLVARSSSPEDSGRSEDLREIARAMGTDYLLQGSVRRSGSRMRISARLISTADNSQVWATALDLAEPDILDAQAYLANTLAALVEPQVQQAEIDRAQRDRPQGSSARDLYLRARSLLSASRQDSHAAAYALISAALRLGPDNVDLISAAAEVLHHGIAVGWPALTDDDRKVSLELAQRGAYLGRRDGAALGMFSNAMFTAHEHDLGGATMVRAIDINPNSSLALICAALGYRYLDRIGLAEELYARALALGPDDPNRKFALSGLANICRIRGDYESAISLATQSMAVNPSFSVTHWTLIASYAQLGRIDQARRALQRYRSIAPGVSIASIRAGQPVTNPRQLDSLLDGLWRAGLPEA